MQNHINKIVFVVDQLENIDELDYYRKNNIDDILAIDEEDR